MALTRVFRSGNSQAVRIPREVVLRKPKRNLGRAFELLSGLSGGFLRGGRRQPRVQKRRGL